MSRQLGFISEITMATLERLRDLGNTVIVANDEEIMRSSDWLLIG